LEITALTFEILLALSDEDRHGYGIIKEIEGRDSPAPSTGAMYLALHRMQAEGLVRQVPAPSESGDARRRYYRITDDGRGAAQRESERLSRLVAAARSKKLLAEDAA
jgi:DNA-binding PadR family transcriptional regulator